MGYQTNVPLTEKWHRWFAWYPVIITAVGEPQTRVWLYFVERRWSPGTHTGVGNWRYRLSQSQNQLAAGE